MRQIIEVLGSTGTPPAKGVRYFNVGNASLLAVGRVLPDSYLSKTSGVAYRAGGGRLRQRQVTLPLLPRAIWPGPGFAVAKVDLSPVETPYNDQRAVYSAGPQPSSATRRRDHRRRVRLDRLLAGTLERVTGDEISRWRP
ncbi:MAG: hypothetical protein R2838_25955 [Caldilineaceae bacterium]